MRMIQESEEPEEKPAVFPLRYGSGAWAPRRVPGHAEAFAPHLCFAMVKVYCKYVGKHKVEKVSVSPSHKCFQPNHTPRIRPKPSALHRV